MSTPSPQAPTTASSSGASSTSSRSNSSNTSYPKSNASDSTRSLPDSAHSNFSISSPSICSFPTTSPSSSSSSSSHPPPQNPRHTPFDHHVLALHRFIFERHAHSAGSIEYQVTDLFIDDRLDELDDPVYLAELETEELAVRHDRLAAVMKELREWKIEAAEMEVLRTKLEVAWRKWERRERVIVGAGVIEGGGGVRDSTKDGDMMRMEEEVDAAVEKIRGVLEWLRGKEDQAREPKELLEKALKALVVGEHGCAG
ncbi:MAG: hypothetical protein Q9184_007017 [Pyrenodesmia sp. 2 TL-2023]